MGSEPFIGAVGIASFNFAPKGWAMCNGQFLPINQNQALFSILGTTYGGNGQTTFALPDLRGRAPMHTGGGHTLGERAGSTVTTLTTANLPSHFHGFTFQPPCNSSSSADMNSSDPTGKYPAVSPASSYGTTADVNLATPDNQTTVTTGNAGGSQPFSVMQPYTVLNFCIALIGIFPSRN